MNIAKVLDESAERWPESLALRLVDDAFQTKNLTYSELSSMVNRFGNGLRSLHVEKGDRVGVFLPFNMLETIISFYACAKIGAISILIDSLFKSNETGYILKSSKANTLITSADYYTSFIKPLLPENLPDLENIIIFDRESFPGAVSYVELLSNSSDELACLDCDNDDLVTLGYTSGTTGNPKGAMLTHGNLMFQCHYGTCYIREIIPGSKILILVPITHSYVSCALLSRSMMMGSTFFVMGPFNPEKCLQVVEKFQIDVVTGSPTVFIYLLKTLERMKFRLDSVKAFTTGSAPVPQEVWLQMEETFPNARIYEFYGLTETSVTVTVDNADGYRKHLSAGRPIFATKLKIVDDKGNRLPSPERGEICVKGPQVMKGYWEMPEETAETIVDGWLYTGDIGYLDEEGYLFIVDRKKDMILASGYNVYPREVEQVLYNHPDVLEAAVIGVPDKVRGETVKCFIVPRKKGILTEEEVIEFCKERLAGYKVPKIIEFVSELPKTTIGKVRKNILK